MKHYDPLALSRYLDNDVTLPVRHELESHLRRCGMCVDQLENLRTVDRVVASWASKSELVSPQAEARIQCSVARRRRLGPLFALSRMTPAAMGSTVAAMLVLASASLGWLAPSPSHVLPPNGAAHVQHLLAKQSIPQRNARVTSAILSGRSVPPEVIAAKYRAMTLD